MVKISPIPKIVKHSNEDGRKIWDALEYFCPTCGKLISLGYRSESACNKCGTFYDWKDHRPKIEIVKTIKW